MEIDGYKFKSGTIISHLLYMDNTKLYAKSEQNINLLIYLTQIYSGMSFGLEKCGLVVVMRGKVIMADEVELPVAP